MRQGLWLEHVVRAGGRHGLGGEVRSSVLRACLEVLAGKCSYFSTLDQRTVLSSIEEGHPLRLNIQLPGGRTGSGQGGRRHLPS